MIIIEVKSKKRCCRKNVKPLNEGALDSFLDSSIGNSMQTYIQKKAAEVLVGYLFGEITPEVKQSIIYKTLIESIGQVDLKDLISVARGDRTACGGVAQNVVTAIIPVINREIADEMKAFAQKAGENLSGEPNPIFNTIVGAMAGSEQIMVNIATEKVKDMPEMVKFAEALCEIEWMGMLKSEFSKVPGIGFIMDKIFEE